MATNTKQIKPLEIPFKEFMPGQLIVSSQFNDDMNDIEDKVNEQITEYNKLSTELSNHTDDVNNPHQVDAHQTGTYNSDEIDGFVAELRNGEFNDNAILNNVLADECVDTRNYRDSSITPSKVDSSFGSQLDISSNIEITTRYTKQETDELIKTKVGDGTYTKEELDVKFEEIQAGVIVDSTIGLEKLKPNVGNELDISRNVSITNRYTKDEVDYLIKTNALPRDWGSILEADIDEAFQSKDVGVIPAADYMVADMFVSPISTALDFDIQEVVDSRNGYDSLNDRLNEFDTKASTLESSINEVKSEVESGFEFILSKIETLETTDIALDSQIKAVNSQVTENKKEVDSQINATNTQINKDRENFNSQLKQINTSIGNVNSELDNIDTQINALNEKDANHETNLSELDSQISTTTSQLEQVKSDVETLKNKPAVPIEIVQQVNKNTDDNKRQDFYINALYNENTDGRLSIEEEGNYLKLEGSKQGLVEVNLVVGDTLVNKSIKFNKKITPNGTWLLIGKITEGTLTPNTLYTLIPTLKGVNQNIQYTNGVNHISIRGFKDICTFTYPSDGLGNLLIYVIGNEINYEVTPEYIILEGDYTNKPIPQECFEGMQSTFEDKLITQEMVDSGEELAENLGKYRVGVKVVGKNKCDNRGNKIADINLNTGIEVQKNGCIVSDFIMVNRDYSCSKIDEGNKFNSLTYRYYDMNKKYLGTTKPNFYPHYVRLRALGKSTDINISLNDIKFQLEEGTDATPYEPYKEYKTSILLGSPLLKGDEIVRKEDGLYHYHKMGKVVLDGSENWVKYNELTNTIVFAIKSFGKLFGKGLCDKIPYILNDSSDTFHCRLDGGGAFAVWAEKTKLPTQDIKGFKEWLQDNPISVIYELAEPYYEKISDDKFILEMPNNATLHIDSAIPCQSVKASYTGKLPSVYKLESDISTIEEFNVDIVATNFDMDYRLLEVEWALEDAGIAGVNLFNILNTNKGVNSMALSRYEQAKIMIIGGAYDKEVLTKQLTRYLEKKIITKEEYDELIALMEAKELVVGK